MRKKPSWSLFAATILASNVFTGAAWAQNNPTASQLIDQLKLNGSPGDTTRGIKPLGPDHSAPAQPAPSANLTVSFATGSADLTPDAMATLDQLGQALASPQLGSDHFKIAGHTDTVGDAGVNQTLSEQRAAAVKSYLESKFNISDARLQAVGLGESDLLVPTPPQTPSQANRRVQIINLGP
jgi:outer membrane protein OmpA-like peptidoglycan-associated protein